MSASPRKRTNSRHLGMSASCHKPTYAVQQIAALFDQLVGAAERPAIFAEREIMEYRARGEDHSPLMPAARITLPHFSVNSTTNLPNSTGELAKGSAPKSTSRALNLGSASAALTSLLRIAMISGGVFAGAAMPSQLLAS